MGLKAAEDTVKNAEEGKKWWDEVDGPHMLQTADLQVKQSQNTTEDQADELDQLRKMYKDEELTSATADIVVKRAVRGLETLRATLRMQQERRDKVKTFDYRIAKQKVIDGVDGARQGLAMAKAQFAQYAAGRQAALNAAKIGMEQAAKRLADLKEDLNWFSVKAPADGTVAYGTLVEGQWVGGDPRALKPGERITSGQVVMRVYTPGKLKVVLPVPESQSFWLEPGMKAKVTPSAAPHQSFQAKCGPVEVVPRGSPAAVGFQVSIDLGDVDPRLLPGMKASVQIDAGKVEGALLVPVAAVTADKVQVRGEGGKVTERSVKVGKSDGQNVEIRHGLKEGDEVVLPGKK
jgi:RND family efflux transporter MFP subunit